LRIFPLRSKFLPFLIFHPGSPHSAPFRSSSSPPCSELSFRPFPTRKSASRCPTFSPFFAGLFLVSRSFHKFLSSGLIASFPAILERWKETGRLVFRDPLSLLQSVSSPNAYFSLLRVLLFPVHSDCTFLRCRQPSPWIAELFQVTLQFSRFLCFFSSPLLDLMAVLSAFPPHNSGSFFFPLNEAPCLGMLVVEGEPLSRFKFPSSLRI